MSDQTTHSDAASPAPAPDGGKGLGAAICSAPHVWKCFHCDFQTTDMNTICNHEKEAHPNEYAESLYREVFGPWE